MRHIKLQRDEDGEWIAEAVNMPGCVVRAATRAEALAEIEAALDQQPTDAPSAESHRTKHSVRKGPASDAAQKWARAKLKELREQDHLA